MKIKEARKKVANLYIKTASKNLSDHLNMLVNHGATPEEVTKEASLSVIPILEGLEKTLRQFDRFVDDPDTVSFEEH